MAKNEIVNVITIKTEESQQTIKGLKKEIADLKKSLDTAVIGSDEFEKASKELAMAQAELKTVMADGKKTTENLEGSYNHLVATMAELKKQWKATADEVKRNELGQQIDTINNQLKELDGTIGNNQRLVGSYAEEFKKALGEQDDATIRTRTQLESVQKVTAGLANGYAAVQGAMTLLNIENENLQKAMVKVQSAMAIAQGVGGLKDLVEGLSRGKVAFKGALTGCKAFIGGLSGVKKAIIGTGIGALVVALGTLIANWDKIVGMFKKDQTEINNLEQSIKDLKEELKADDEDFDFFIRLEQAAGKSREEILKLIKAQKSQKFDKADEVFSAAVDSLEKYTPSGWSLGKDEDLEKLIAAVNEAKAIRDAAYKEWEKASQNLTIYQTEQETKRTKDAKEAAAQRAKDAKAAREKQKQDELDATEFLRQAKLSAYEKEVDALDKKYTELITIFKNDKEKQLEVLQWYTDEYQKIVEKQLDEEIAAQQNANKELSNLTAEQYSEKVAASEKRLDKKMQGIDSGAETAMYLNERKKPEGNGEINAIDNELSKIETLKNITNETLNLKVAAIEAEQKLFEESSERWMELENQKVALREQTNRTLLELEDQLKQQTDAKQRALAGSITKTFTAAMQSASAIIGALQEGIDTTTKEGFEKNKKMQIAQATIQMLVGITSALAGAYTTKTGPWDWVLAGIQAATIGATGAIQIANIKKQTFDGGGSGSANVSVSPSIGFADVPVSYTRNLMGDKETENLNQEQRVYILESDIEESGRRVEVRDSNTNF